ncbi:TetR/AcrR family transcriptional regulator [Nocardioides nitrophenolicus]|uniref:TetR/AcrR family transcriptional regulator n=1 Tax=Nocardioides nitrophenolicus TaxID=60489 RepID=UPI00195A8DD2|nr:TetR/AcrR family transcriptional regulator [Nocardioides nitrophenolicus]MBM7518461.1 AcrR family transcriptional regulator [Nocardioides nitrophenolicus]
MSSQVFEAPRQGLNPRQAETVERLLAAGLEELRAVGHEALTVRTVAQRAGVSPATAYTYLASKNHLFAELFWRHLTSAEIAQAATGTPTERLQATMRALTARIVEEPELAAAVTPALLGSDPDVARLRLKIGGAFLARFEAALGEQADPAVLEVLVLTFSGALLQAGMGLLTYDQIAERLVAAVDVIMRGNR